MFFKELKEPGGRRFIDIRSFFTRLLPFGSFHSSEALMRGEIIGVGVPDTGEKIIKGTDTGDVIRAETAEDGPKRAEAQSLDPLGNGSIFEFEGKQVRAEHAGRLARFRTKERIGFSQDLVCKGEVEVPELDNDLPVTLRDRKRVRVIPKEVIGKEILIGLVGNRGINRLHKGVLQSKNIVRPPRGGCGAF